ncbi:MAG: gamma-glutamylcyclotransferase family protein [Kiloniellales bacterium]|nr:gamma-glutamylcyclotransferase family protein [Kiloniellales bacterium]
MRLFFYGTLRDPDVRRLVFGDRAEGLIVRPALLLGFRTCSARRGEFPVLVRRTGGRARGELVESLGYGDLLRLFHFEGPDYLPSNHVAIDDAGRRLAAWVLLPDSAQPASAQSWRLRRWQLYRKPRVMPRLQLWMREFDRFQEHSVEIAWPVRRQLKAWRETGELDG